MNYSDGGSTEENKFSEDEKVCIRLRGIPFRVNDEEVHDFFSGYDVIKESLIIGVRPDGLRTGQAVILAESEEEARTIIEDKNGHTIGDRWIELYNETFGYYKSFYDNGLKIKDISITGILKGEENIERCVKLRGIPFNCERKDIVDFMSEYAVEEANVHFEYLNNKFSGRAIVFLENDVIADKVKNDLDKKYIKNRYIEVIRCTQSDC